MEEKKRKARRYYIQSNKTLIPNSLFQPEIASEPTVLAEFRKHYESFESFRARVLSVIPMVTTHTNFVILFQ